jgi:hypothetical protein
MEKIDGHFTVQFHFTLRAAVMENYLLSIWVNGMEKKNSVALVRERTIPTERPPPVGEVSANFCG